MVVVAVDTAGASELDGGSAKAHPKARPRKLPRIRRGMYRPGAISSQAVSGVAGRSAAASCGSTNGRVIVHLGLYLIAFSIRHQF